MHYVVLFTLLTALVLADAQFWSYSPAAGPGSGNSYNVTGEGRITAVRVWEAYNNFIYGFQFRYGVIWSPVAGILSGDTKEIELNDGEAIIQISGKYSLYYLQSVVFVTNRGRSLQAGQPIGHSFNMYSNNSEAELRMISGRFNGAITSIGAHWVVPSNNTES